MNYFRPCEVARSVRASVRTAQTGSADYRKEMEAKRYRLIWAMHWNGMTQETIEAELEVPQRTVSDVIERPSEKRSGAKTAKATLNEPLMV